MALETLDATAGRSGPGRAGALPGRTRRSRLPGRRARPVDPGGPAPVSVSRATVIDTRPMADVAEAGAWLAGIDLPAEATAGLRVVNRLIGAHRIAAADPYAHELPPGAALAVRAGFGEGQEVADGGWTRAVEQTSAAGGWRRRAKSALHPEERLAALLSAQDRPLACEELALRARADLDLERPLAAALGTRLALEAALVELGADARASGLEDRLAELRDLRDDVIAAANSTLVGPLAEAQRQRVAHALGRIEATLRARTARRTLR